MKKFLVVLLSAMMVFAFATTAFAAGQYSDVADLSKETQDAISKLSALEIIGGYPDGTFKPSATITRAEFAKMACVASGMQESADILVNTASQFSDVKAGEWYTGYINLAVSQGFVKGYPDGTFKPNNTITNAEVITVILRILGYNDNLPGPWPVDYVAKAGALEITSGVVSVSSANAVRSDVARMIDNALEEDIVMWDKDVEEFVEKNGKTLLADSFKGQILEDQKVKEWNVDSFSKGNLKLVVANDDNKTTGFTVTDATVISGGYNIYGINDMIVDVIYKYDKDLEKDVVKYVDVTSSKVKATKASLMSNGKIKLGDKQYSVEDGVKVPEAPNAFYTGYLDEDGVVYLVKNDKNASSDSYIVDEYFASSERISTKVGSSLNLRNQDVIIMNADGEEIEADDLKEFDLIKVYEDKNDVDYVIFVEEWQEGTLNTSSDKKVEIDGITYADTATYFEDGDIVNPDQDYIGTKVKFALNAKNEVIGIIYTETGLGNSVYGIVISGSYGESFVDEVNYWETLTIFNDEGKTVKYDVEASEIKKDDASFKAGDLVKFRLNKDGEIHAISTDDKDNEIILNVNSSYIDSPLTKAEVDTTNERISLGGKTYPIDSKIVGFDVDFKTNNEVDKVTLISSEDIAKGDVKGKSIVYVLNANRDGVAAIAVENFSSSRNDSFGFVKTLGLTNADVDNGVRFYGDSAIYEIVAPEGGIPGGALSKNDFVRFEISGDDAEIINNFGDYDLTEDSEDVCNVTRTSKGIYYTDGESVLANKDGVKATSFTIEDDTVILEVTLNKDGSIYDVKATNSVGTGDRIVFACNDDTDDSFETMEAMFVIVVNDTQADQDGTATGGNTDSLTEKELADLKATATKTATVANADASTISVQLANNTNATLTLADGYVVIKADGKQGTIDNVEIGKDIDYATSAGKVTVIVIK